MTKLVISYTGEIMIKVIHNNKEVIFSEEGYQNYIKRAYLPINCTKMPRSKKIFTTYIGNTRIDRILKDLPPQHQVLFVIYNDVVTLLSKLSREETIKVIAKRNLWNKITQIGFIYNNQKDVFFYKLHNKTGDIIKIFNFSKEK
jgi:hypothetical protein